uniref:Uncharacterized protein n=1 Tax=Oryctolagus cuniculus TaxID=9986 RepID=A0A5F9DDT9_RABIT
MLVIKIYYRLLLLSKSRVFKVEASKIKIKNWHAKFFTVLIFWLMTLFLRELVGDTGSQEGDHEPSGSETEEDASASPHRIRSARQRRAPAEEGH